MACMHMDMYVCALPLTRTRTQEASRQQAGALMYRSNQDQVNSADRLSTLSVSLSSVDGSASAGYGRTITRSLDLASARAIFCDPACALERSCENERTKERAKKTYLA